TRFSIRDQLRITACRCRDDRKARRHGLEYGVRDTFAARAEDEQVEIAHQLRNVVATAGQPGILRQSRGGEPRLGLCPKRAIADHHEPQGSGARSRRASSLNEALDEIKRILDGTE